MEPARSFGLYLLGASRNDAYTAHDSFRRSVVPAMSKPYTDVEFSEQITADRSWRIKEISDLKEATKRADVSLRRVLLRALVTICYAHWEGYVRFAAYKYHQHVAVRKIKYKDLDRQFFRNYFLPRLSALSSSKKSLADRCALIHEVLTSSDRRYSKVNDSLINAKDNLNFEVFCEACLLCCVPVDPFADRKAFLDIFLLKRRNAIAHGEETFLEIDELDELTSETIAMMRAFGDALENHVYLKSYRSA